MRGRPSDEWIAKTNKGAWTQWLVLDCKGSVGRVYSYSETVAIEMEERVTSGGPEPRVFWLRGACGGFFDPVRVRVGGCVCVWS